MIGTGRSWRASPSNRQAPSSRPHDRDRDRVSTANPPRNQANHRNTEASSSHVPSTQSPQPAQNAWTDRSRSQSGSLRGAPTTRGTGYNTNPTAGAGGAASGGVVEEKHVPVAGFNADEVRESLRKSHQDIVFGDTLKQALYRPPGDNSGAASTTTPTSGTSGSTPRAAWGKSDVKPSAMANGQDFLVQLKKQMAALEQGRGG